MGSRNKLLLAAGFVLACTASARADDIVIHAGRLIDGFSRAPRSNVSIVIHNDRIVSVDAGFTTPAGARVIDLSNATVLPGLIDCHVHLTSQFDGGNPVAEAVTQTQYDEAVNATAYARATLLAGFTSVRDVGADVGPIVALRNAIAKGTVEGPRLWVAGPPLGPTGGHNDPANGFDPALNSESWKTAIVDSADDARRVVRELRRDGVNLIKIMPSGGVLSVGDDPNQQLMTDDEIKAVIDTAHSLGLKVAAHAHGKRAIMAAVRLGVDSIEHGSYGDAETYKLMKEHGTYLVPTMLVAKTALDLALAHPEQLNPSSAKKAQMVGPIIRNNVHNAYLAGVKIAFGTDEGLAPHGANAQEFALLVDAGMAPMDAIIAATGSAADLIGDSADIGSLQAGRYADIVAVNGDPLADVTTLEHMQFVMKGGIVYRDGGQIVPR